MHYTICDFLLDLIHNSLEAGANSVDVSFIELPESISVVVRDNGKGMDKETVLKATDPFYTDGSKHKERKLGLGIPFLLHMIHQVNGTWQVDSVPGSGTTVSFSLPAGHIDLPPTGDIPGCILSAFCFADKEISVFRERSGKFRYTIKRSELLEALGDLTDAGALVLAKKYLESMETE